MTSERIQAELRGKRIQRKTLTLNFKRKLARMNMEDKLRLTVKSKDFAINTLDMVTREKFESEDILEFGWREGYVWMHTEVVIDKKRLNLRARCFGQCCTMYSIQHTWKEPLLALCNAFIYGAVTAHYDMTRNAHDGRADNFGLRNREDRKSPEVSAETSGAGDTVAGRQDGVQSMGSSGRQ